MAAGAAAGVGGVAAVAPGDVATGVVGRVQEVAGVAAGYCGFAQSFPAVGGLSTGGDAVSLHSDAAGFAGRDALLAGYVAGGAAAEADPAGGGAWMGDGVWRGGHRGTAAVSGIGDDAGDSDVVRERVPDEPEHET